MLPKKKLLVFGVIILGILLVALITLVGRKKSQTALISDIADDYVDENVSQSPVVDAPTMTFSSFNVNSPDISLPPSVKSYSLLKNYSEDFAAKVGETLLLTEKQSGGNKVILYNLEDELNRGYLLFDKTNGNYKYVSYGKFSLPATSDSVNENLRNFLVDSGLIDQTVDCDINYQKTDVENATFVECHRNWEKAGLPILNFAGLINLPEDYPLSDLNLGMVEGNAADDPTIINVSTGEDGKKRPDDFNTLTAAIDNEGNLIGLSSNLKSIDDSGTYGQDQIITPEEAIARLKENDTSYSLVVPADDFMEWNTVFPDNAADNLNASVSDLSLVYLDGPKGTESMVPMYLARGTATTESGQSVKFIQAVSALNSDLSNAGEVAGFEVSAQSYPTGFDDTTLKLGTFNPDQRATSITYSGECVPAEEQLSPILSLGDLGQLGKWTISAPSPQDTGDSGPYRWFRSGQWYLIPANQEILPEINQVVSAFDALPLEGRGSNIRELDNLNKEWEKYNFCPLRVSGGSPTLIAYGKSDAVYEVNVGRKLVYVKANDDNSLYYEYLPVTYTRPEKGWNINKNELKEFTSGVAGKLKINSSEAKKLYFELNQAAAKVDSEKLFIGVIANDELDSKVPLKVTPNVNVQRFHFYVSEAVKKTEVPDLGPVTRHSEMLLEFGAVAQ